MTDLEKGQVVSAAMKAVNAADGTAEDVCHIAAEMIYRAWQAANRESSVSLREVVEIVKEYLPEDD